MKPVYTASNPAEAHMIVHMLQSHDINAEIQGELLQGSVGGIPASGTLKILVPEKDYNKANALIKEVEERPSLFTKPKPIKAKSGKILLLIIVFSLGYITSPFLDASRHKIYSNMQSNSLRVDQHDYQNDGIIDEKVTYKKHRLLKSEYDKDSDGVFDEITFYDRKGFIEKVETDYDFNGTFETISYYDGVNINYVEIDRDDNQKIDIKKIYKNSSPSKTYYFNEGTKIPLKVEYYKDSYLYSAEYDSNKNGQLDMRYFYDEHNEIIKTEKIN